jgi:CheY-like chemotaxis protein
MAVILAIDEDVVLTMSLDLQLGHVGHIVRRANTLALATQYISEQQPTLIVIDPSVDNHTGWQIIEQWAHKLPVMVISHDPTPATANRAQTLGIQGFMAKPFLMRDLVALLTPFIQPATTPVIEKSIDANEDTKPKRNGRKKNQSTDSQKTIPATPPQKDALGLSMSDADELLLVGLPTTIASDTYTQPKKESLGSRLRAERTKRNIPLTQIDLAIGVHMTYVQAMEEDRFSHLPRGRMAEEMITKDVSYLGLNVQGALDDYRGVHYSEAVEPITAFGADKLQFFSYGRSIRVVLALLVLTGIGYGIYIVDHNRVNSAGGGVIKFIFPDTPTRTATATATPSATPTTTPTVTLSATPSLTFTPSLTATKTQTATRTASNTRTMSATRTLRPSRTSSLTRTLRPSRTPRTTQTPSPSRTVSLTQTSSTTPIGARTSPTATATRKP